MARGFFLVFAFSLAVCAAEDNTFSSQVAPVFNAKCNGCHGPTKMGKLDLRTSESALLGGASGPAIVPGASAKSLLMDKIVTGQMPPGPQKMTAAEMDAVRTWIDRDLKKIEPAAIVSSVTEHEVRGIIQARCVLCHGAGKKSGGLDLRTLESRLKGGKSGPALVPGKPEESLIYKRMADGSMPPAKGAKELAIELPTDPEVAKMKAWIAAGAPAAVKVTATPDAVVTAKDKQHWAFNSPVRPAVPASELPNPIDAFLLAKLKSKNLTYAPEAGRLELLRRATLDLTGLPPTPAEIAAYEADTKPGAYERLIDRLLASPRYGERWGQHWLDLAGYADSEGFGQDDGVRPFAWRYRDYVIRSLNADKPYNLFLKEQLAGDEMSDDWRKAKGVASQDMLDRLAATGFLRTVPDPTNSNERGLIAERMNVVADEVEVLASSVMGLTMGCARCHNHKYDPIPQRDYYRLSAIIQGAYDPYEWRSPNKREYDLALESERAVVNAHNAPLDAEMDKLKARIKTLTDGYREQLKAKGEKSDLSDNELGKKFPELSKDLKPLQEQLDETRRKRKPKPHVRILNDNEEPSVSYLLRRGDPVGFADPVEPAVPLVLQNASLKPYEPRSPFPGTSGRRLALAEWLTQPNHPLTARVAVNQIWMRHFGRGIVPSVSNFGRIGVPPTNPELLDWLATEFVDKGWSMKAMHRLMMTSRAYRQSSRVDSKVVAADPENALVSRMTLRRMDAETLYDSLVAVAGRLDATAYGPAVAVDIKPNKEVTAKAAGAGYRRAIYTLKRRQTPLSLLDAFDQPAMTPNCTERRQSNVATQALHMMNGSITWELSKFLAGRLVDDGNGQPAKEVEQLYLRAYGRRPSAAELQTGIEAVAEFERGWPARLEADHYEGPRASTAHWLALANLSHVLLNSAEFSFID